MNFFTVNSHCRPKRMRSTSSISPLNQPRASPECYKVLFTFTDTGLLSKHAFLRIRDLRYKYKKMS